ncbi:MAG: hypothetical protein HFJ10_11135 [Lachnospiraceae bacterium]|jgi:hypothetical protein|nr:hypothetical protein [Lachnospiraceae bacterium]
MKDVVLEWCIPYVMPPGKRLLKAVMTAAIVVLLVDMIFYPMILFLPFLIYLVVAVLVLRSWKYEYEYVYVNGDLQISKIIRKEKRKDVYHCERNEIEYVTEGRKRIAGCKSYDFTSGWEKGRVYTMKIKNELVYLEPNDEFLEEMSRYRKLEKN